MSEVRPIRVYLDSNILIHLIEGSEAFKAVLWPLVEAIDEGGIVVVTSDIAYAEVMVKPFANNQDTYIHAHGALMSGAGPLQIAPVTRAVLKRSGQLRAQLGGKLADSIHVATAVEEGCSHFVSEDAGIRAPEGLELTKAADLPGLLVLR